MHFSGCDENVKFFVLVKAYKGQQSFYDLGNSVCLKLFTRMMDTIVKYNIRNVYDTEKKFEEFGYMISPFKLLEIHRNSFPSLLNKYPKFYETHNKKTDSDLRVLVRKCHKNMFKLTKKSIQRTYNPFLSENKSTMWNIVTINGLTFPKKEGGLVYYCKKRSKKKV